MDVLGDIERCNKVADGLRASLHKMIQDGDDAIRRGYERERQLQEENDSLRERLGGAVKENRKLWARDHARGHRPTPKCHVCVRFGDVHPGRAGGR